MIGGFTFGIFVWLLVFKLTGIISMSWWIVWLPVMIYAGIVLAVWFSFIAAWLVSRVWKRKEKED